MKNLAKARINGCLIKKRYPSKSYAEMVGRVERRKRGVTLRVYHCQFGDHYHLTKKRVTQELAAHRRGPIQVLIFDQNGRLIGLR